MSITLDLKLKKADKVYHEGVRYEKTFFCYEHKVMIYYF